MSWQWEAECPNPDCKHGIVTITVRQSGVGDAGEYHDERVCDTCFYGSDSTE
jgi:hypothetical protein